MIRNCPSTTLSISFGHCSKSPSAARIVKGNRRIGRTTHAILVLPRSHIRDFAKDCRKVALVRESDSIADIRDGVVACREQLLRLRHPQPFR